MSRTGAAGTPLASNADSTSADERVRAHSLDQGMQFVGVVAPARRASRTAGRRPGRRGPIAREGPVGEGVGGRADREPAVAGVEGAERREAGHERAGPQREADRLERVERLARDERREAAEHRHVDVLAVAGALGLHHRGERADDREQRRDQVADRQAEPDRVRRRARRRSS